MKIKSLLNVALCGVAAASFAVALPFTASAGTTITGAGASFPAPIYTEWFKDFKGASGITVNYQSIGSGSGIKTSSDILLILAPVTQL